jgi:hypothetical protein
MNHVISIEIRDEEAETILAGLRSGDSAVVSRIADLLQQEVDLHKEYPFEVFLDDKHRDNFSSIVGVREEFEDGPAHERIDVYHRIQHRYLTDSEIWLD